MYILTPFVSSVQMDCKYASPKTIPGDMPIHLCPPDTSLENYQYEYYPGPPNLNGPGRA